MTLESLYEAVDRHWDRRAAEEGVARTALLGVFEQVAGPVPARDVEAKVVSSTGMPITAVHSALWTLIGSRLIDDGFDGVYRVRDNQ